MYVCIYIYTPTLVSKYAYMCVCTHVYIHLFTYLCIYAKMYLSSYENPFLNPSPIRRCWDRLRIERLGT